MAEGGGVRVDKGRKPRQVGVEGGIGWMKAENQDKPGGGEGGGGGRGGRCGDKASHERHASPVMLAD